MLQPRCSGVRACDVHPKGSRCLSEVVEVATREPTGDVMAGQIAYVVGRRRTDHEPQPAYSNRSDGVRTSLALKPFEETPMYQTGDTCPGGDEGEKYGSAEM